MKRFNYNYFQLLKCLLKQLMFFFLQTTPTSEEVGHCDEIRVSEIGGTSVTLFKQGSVWVTYCSAIDVTKSLLFLWLLLFYPMSNWSIQQIKA